MGWFFLISVQLAVNCIFKSVCLSLNILLSIFCTLQKELPEIHVQLGKVQKSLSSHLLHWFGDCAVFVKTDSFFSFPKPKAQYVNKSGPKSLFLLSRSVHIPIQIVFVNRTKL